MLRMGQSPDALLYSNLDLREAGEITTALDQAGIKYGDLRHVSPKWNTIDRNLGNTDGHEIDLYAEWHVNDHLSIMPLVGLFQPDKSADQGGTQLGNNDKNLYSQVIFATTF